jgi:hypothetical protein
MPQFRLPQTVYAVAIYYVSLLTADYYLCSRIVIVSGENPLTDAEAVARVRKDLEENWPAPLDPAHTWRLASACVSRATLTR